MALTHWGRVMHICISRLTSFFPPLSEVEREYQIHFICTHLIKQLPKVCRVWSFIFQNLIIWSFGKFFTFVTLTLSCFDLGSNINYSIVCVIMGRQGGGYPQNAGVLVVLAGSDHGLSPGRYQAIVWAITGILLKGPTRTNFSDILIKIHTFSLKKMHLKMVAILSRP